MYDISFSEQVIADVVFPTESPYNVNNILVTKLWIILFSFQSFVFLQVLTLANWLLDAFPFN